LILDAAKTSRDGSAVPPAKRIYQKHKDWVRDLAVAELIECAAALGAQPLMLSPAKVRFQLACDESPDLPDVLCF
jgi:hypothetical protein